MNCARVKRDLRAKTKGLGALSVSATLVVTKKTSKLVSWQRRLESLPCDGDEERLAGGREKAERKTYLLRLGVGESAVVHR